MNMHVHILGREYHHPMMGDIGLEPEARRFRAPLNRSVRAALSRPL
jgi:hypothetical protein